MEIKVTVLGTSGSSPTKFRSLPSVAFTYNGEVLLFDCGEGTQMQMLKYGVNSSKIKGIFISHAHGDHVIGIAGLVRTMALNGRKNELKIFVPKGYEQVIKALLVFDKAFLGYKISVVGIKSGSVYKGKEFEVVSFPLNHSITSYGYVFKEDDKRRFDKKKCDKLGITGMMYSELEDKGKLKVGKKIILLNQVTTLNPGKRVVYASDSRPVQTTVTAAKNSELLIHEASYAHNELELAQQRKHSTAVEAAEIAKKAKVKALVLTHISARYTDSRVLEIEAKRVFKNVKVANDGDNIFI